MINSKLELCITHKNIDILGKNVEKALISKKIIKPLKTKALKEKRLKSIQKVVVQKIFSNIKIKEPEGCFTVHEDKFRNWITVKILDIFRHQKPELYSENEIFLKHEIRRVLYNDREELNDLL